jgi:predicted tellurium resistance membrane protein TerC
MFEWVFRPEAWVALATLTSLEIVLGVDNILFISILSDNLPEKQRDLTRRLGLVMALLGRLIMLFFIFWIMQLSEPLFTVLGETFSGKDLILIGGGLFLLGKSTTEIHDNLEGPDQAEDHGAAPATMGAVLFQVFMLDAVFSIDSVITAIGLVDTISIIVVAMVIAMGVMIVSVNVIGEFIEEHPSFKMLALSFLILVGTVLVTDGMGVHVPRGYIYFAMAFSAGVEVLNMKMRQQRKKAVHLRKQPPPESGE